jgi:hypothetical protein
MPRDREARPSTVEGLVTPLRVTHHLAVEVVFSIWGEDAFGQSIKDGPGDQRRLKIARGVALPACPILPQVFSLPACKSSSVIPLPDISLSLITYIIQNTSILLTRTQTQHIQWTNTHHPTHPAYYVIPE